MKPAITKQQWLDWISEQPQSGLSIAAFCRENGINAGNFYYHRGQCRKQSRPENATFMRAQLAEEPSAIKNQPEMTLCVGLSRLQIPTNVSPQWLAALMASLA